MNSSLNEERGFVVPLVAVLSPVLIAILGLMIDFGIAASNYFKLANAVDAAAYAALDSYDEALWEEEGVIEIEYSVARNKALVYLHENLEEATLREFQLLPNGKGVRVKAEVNSPVFFMKMFGIGDRTITSVAEAELKEP